ncbi:MAG TPA: response regulator transcription factor [Trueperaceae bacterium]
MTGLAAEGTRPAASVLVVEDEPALAEVLSENLVEEGYDVTVAGDGAEALAAWRRETPDLVVLDVMLPHVDGFEVCRVRRAEGDSTPVLFLSARGEAVDRITGLEAGADDYLTKPFHLHEFLLRVRALLKRTLPAPAQRLAFGGHVVDFRTWTARLDDGREVQLSERELGILRVLAERAGEVVSRDEIMDRVWGDDTFPSSRTIDNFIVRLRRHFEPDTDEPVYIHTVWGVGYRFTPDATPASSAGPERAGEERPA